VGVNVVVAGGHGQVARRLLGLLAQRGDVPRGLIRNPDHAPDLEGIGAEPVLVDLEKDDIRADVLAGADAVVFAAGAGPGSGAARKRTMDLGGALKLIDAARASGIARYVMVSAMGAANPPGGSEGMAPYLRAKAEADQALASSGLDYTIVRPGRLTNEPGTGRVAAAAKLNRRGEIARDDVAATLLAVLGAENTIGKTFELLRGETPIEAAVATL
jgi:uncharacterized protein YbjT (DUF2867 family)